MEHNENTGFQQNDWNEYARCYDALLALIPYLELRDKVSATLAPTPQDDILDAGCGTGNLLSVLGERYEPRSLTGIDLSESMLQRAQEKCTESTTTLTKCSLSERLPYDDGAFTKIASMNVLYALDDPRFTLTELHRVLAPEGRIVVVTPKRDYDNGLILKAHARSPKDDSYWQHPHTSEAREKELIEEAMRDPALAQMMIHVALHNRIIARTARFHFFTEDEFATLLDSSGFSVTSFTSAYADQCMLVCAEKRGVS